MSISRGSGVYAQQEGSSLEAMPFTNSSTTRNYFPITEMPFTIVPR